MKLERPQTQKPTLFTALKQINERMESLALIMTQMSENNGIYAKHPVSQSDIDHFFGRH